MGQVLSVYLPQWDVELIRRQKKVRQRYVGRARKAAVPPLLLTVDASRQEYVARCCGGARAAGVAPGMGVAEARALCPAARVMAFDPEYSRTSLGLLAEWAMRFSPVVAMDGTPMAGTAPTPEGVVLEVTGTAHLFGGEQLFLVEIVTRLQRMGFSARAAVAPTLGAAWAVARFGPSPLAVVSEAHLTAALQPLPITALRLSPASCAGFLDIGIERIGHLLRLPREGLLVRFGEEVLWRLDQMFGRVDERIEPIRPGTPLIVQRLFDGASTQLEAVMLSVQELLAELAAYLLAREAGVRGLRVELARMNDPPVSREVMLGRPSRDARHLWSLLRPKVEGMHLGHGVEGITLTATWVETIRHGQGEIWAGEAHEHDQAFEAFLDTLVNRWGTKRVLSPAPAASHVPERAYRLVPSTELKTMSKQPMPQLPWLDRPSRLLERAEPAEAMALQPDYPPRWLRWRGDDYPVVTGIGPERIMATHHPLRQERTRDYFKVQITGGRWLWVYRELETGAWFVHGLWA